MAKFGKLEKPFTELEYIDNRPIFFPALTAYKNGLTLKSGEIVKVTANEKIKLLKMKNGKRPCWKEVSFKKVEPVKEINNG